MACAVQYDRSRASVRSGSRHRRRPRAPSVLAAVLQITDTGGLLRLGLQRLRLAAPHGRALSGRGHHRRHLAHGRDTAGPMAVSMADVELLDARGHRRRQGRAGRAEERAPGSGQGLPGRAGCRYPGRLRRRAVKLGAAGVTLVEVDMPRLMELNGAVGFPVALYEAIRRRRGLPQAPPSGAEHPADGRGRRQPRRGGHLPGPGDPAQAAGARQHRGRCAPGLRGRP